MAEKTEEPTQKKLQDARKEGQVVKSELITRGAQLLALTLWFWVQGPRLVVALQDAFDKTIHYVLLPLEDAYLRVFMVCLDVLLHFVLSLILVVFLTTVSAIVAQIGFLFAFKKLLPKMDALNPVNNLKNIFSLKKFYGIFRTVLIVILLTTVFFHIFRTYSRSFLYLPACGVQCALPLIGKLTVWFFICLIAFYIAFATIDYLFERYQLRKQLRMSKQDIRQEYKDIESNPEMKGFIRGKHNELQQEDSSSRVQKASAVVRNPTHLAVCLYYEPEETPLPMVIEKGAGSAAEKIIQLARRFKIPTFENVSLARKLMADTKIGDYIPEALFEPVAEILRIAMLEREEALEEDLAEISSSEEHDAVSSDEDKTRDSAEWADSGVDPDLEKDAQSGADAKESFSAAQSQTEQEEDTSNKGIDSEDPPLEPPPFGRFQDRV